MRIALYCKTFRDDFRYLANLLSSFEIYVAPTIDLILSMPKADVPTARSLLSIPARCTIVEDEAYIDDKAFRIGGWMQQQVCKLSMFKVSSHDAVLFVDSDTYFIRQLTEQDIVAPDGRLNLVASTIHTRYSAQNIPLKAYLAEPGYQPAMPTSSLQSTEVDALSLVRRNIASPHSNAGDRSLWIYELFGIDVRLSFMPSGIFSVSSLRAFYEEICASNGLILSDIISIAPWEFTWYACWVIWRRLIHSSQSCLRSCILRAMRM